jgi:hypothetical protein
MKAPAFDDLTPRIWFGGQPQGGRGAWLLGLDWLLAWMFSFGPEHGLHNGDLRRLDATAGPHGSAVEPRGCPPRATTASAMDPSRALAPTVPTRGQTVRAV